KKKKKKKKKGKKKPPPSTAEIMETPPMTGPKEGNKSDATQLPKKPTIIFPIMPPGTSFPKIAPAIAPIIPPTINAHRKLNI
ncbi:hypothetical protein HMPREF9514_00171, partial [Enterococcus faecalis TX0855]